MNKILLHIIGILIIIISIIDIIILKTPINNNIIFYIISFILIIFSLGKNIEITIIDLTLLLFISFRFIDAALYNRIDFLVLINTLSIIYIYIYIKSNNNSSLSIIGLYLIINGLLQCFIITLQLSDIIQSKNQYFKAIGGFANPNIVSFFILLPSVILTNSILENKKNKQQCIYQIALLIVFIFFLIITNSKGCIIAYLSTLILGITYLNKRKHYIIPIILIISLIVIYKGISYPRLLIWEVSTDIIKTNPIFGIGSYNFSPNYMLYQSNFFKNHPNYSLTIFSNNNHFPYNEYLYYVCENGIIGLLFLSLFGYILFKRIANYRALISISISIIVYIFFYNSFDNYKISLIIFSLIAIISKYCRPIFNIKLISNTSILSVLIISCLYRTIYKDFSSYYSNYLNLESEKKYCLNNIQISLIQANKISSYLYNSDNKNYEYIIALENLYYKYPNSEIALYLGYIYKINKNVDKAEYFFKESYYLVPARITSLYELFQLYKESNQSEKALQIAPSIINHKTSIVNSKTLNIKKEAISYINKKADKNISAPK